MSAFDDIALHIGNALGSTQEVGGFIAAMAFIITVTIMIEWVIGSERRGSSSLMASLTIGFIFSVIFGWLPLWTVILVVIVVGLILFNPFGDE